MRRAMSWAKITGLLAIALVGCYVLYAINQDDGYYKSQSVRIAELGNEHESQPVDLVTDFS